MAVKDDYVMRMIKDMARVLARLILGKDDINYVLPEDEEFTVIDNLYKKLITMADAGQINEAENILLNELEDKSSEYFEMAASFYKNPLNDRRCVFIRNKLIGGTLRFFVAVGRAGRILTLPPLHV